jgi:hypothetical protein
MDSEYYLIHLSDIIFNDKTIRVYWHQIKRAILLEYNNQLYNFAMPGTKSYDVTVRQLLNGLGVDDTMQVDIRLDSSKAHDFTAEDILDGDCWNTITHQIRIYK